MNEKPNAEFILSCAEAKQAFSVPSTGGDKNWQTLDAGSIKLPAGAVELKLECQSISEKGWVKIGNISLKPQD